MTDWSFYAFETRLVSRAGRVAVLAGQAGAKDMAVRPYLTLPPGGPAPWAVGRAAMVPSVPHVDRGIGALVTEPDQFR